MSGAQLVGGVLCVPPELLAVLLAELEAARSPTGVAMPKRTPAMAALVDLVRQGAIEHRRTQRQRASAASSPVVAQSTPEAFFPAPVVANRWHSKTPPFGSDGSQELVNVARAAEMLDRSPQWVRYLCAHGTFALARKVRGKGCTRWLIPRQAIHDYQLLRLERPA